MKTRKRLLKLVINLYLYYKILNHKQQKDIYHKLLSFFGKEVTLKKDQEHLADQQEVSHPPPNSHETSMQFVGTLKPLSFSCVLHSDGRDEDEDARVVWLLSDAGKSSTTVVVSS